MIQYYILLVSYRDAAWLLRSFENLNFGDALLGLVPRVRAAAVWSGRTASAVAKTFRVYFAAGDAGWG